MYQWTVEEYTYLPYLAIITYFKSSKILTINQEEKLATCHFNLHFLLIYSSLYNKNIDLSLILKLSSQFVTKLL